MTPELASRIEAFEQARQQFMADCDAAQGEIEKLIALCREEQRRFQTPGEKP